MNFKLEDKKMRTAMIHCLNKDNSAVKHKMISLGARDISKIILDACKIDDLTKVRKYYERNLNFDARLDAFGASAACCAASHGSTRVLTWLCRQSRSKDNLGLDYQGGTPLHYAANFQQIESIQILLKYRVPIDIQDANGESPLHCAITTGNLEICKLLIEGNANVNLVDKGGRNQLMRGAALGWTGICGLLIEASADVNFQND